ncbi:MAG TPA: hypothetical protein VIY86_09220 [Pirellulaceae bacterium]
MRIIVLSNDLRTTSRICADSVAAGWEASTCLAWDPLHEQMETVQPDVVLLDLASIPAHPSEIQRLKAVARGGTRLIAFGPHVQTEKLQAARDAGCDHVVTNGQIHRDLKGVLGIEMREP